MPLRTNIASSITVPQSRSNPLSTLKGIQDLNEQRSLIDARDQQTEIRRRALEDDDTARRVMSASKNPDEGADELYRIGLFDHANEITKGLAAERKSRADDQLQKITTSQKALGAAAHMYEKLGDNPDQREYDTVTTAVEKMIPPELFTLIPKVYDKEKTHRMLAWATDQSELARQTQQAIENANKANEIQNANATSFEQRVKNRREAGEYWKKSAAALLGRTTSQQDWDNKQRILMEQGASAIDLAPFGRQWSDQAVENARQMGMDVVQQNANDHQVLFTEPEAEQRMKLARKADARAERAAANPTTLKQLTPNAVDEIEAHKDRQLEEFEKDQRKPGEGVGNPMAGLRPIDDTSPEAKTRRATTKLAIENRARNRKGEASFEDAEVALASEPGQEAKLKKLRAAYRAITEGQDMPLEHMEKLAGKIKTEQDPAKRAALVKELRDYRQQQDGR